MKIKKIIVLLLLIAFSFSGIVASNLALKKAESDNMKNWMLYISEPGFSLKDSSNLNIKDDTAEFVVLNFMRAVLSGKNDYFHFLSNDIKKKYSSKLVRNIEQGILMKSFHLKARVNYKLINTAAVFKGMQKRIVKEFGRVDCIIFAENSKQADFFFFMRKEQGKWKIAIAIGPKLLHI